VLIGVGAGDGGGGGIVVVPGAELTVGANFAGRLGVVEASVEGERIAFADMIEEQMIDAEDEAFRAALAGHKFEDRVVGGNIADG
jgi:hypothetical protein